jgi:hypothetical protein
MESKDKSSNTKVVYQDNTTVKGKLVEKQGRKVNRSKVGKKNFYYYDGWAA